MKSIVVFYKENNSNYRDQKLVGTESSVERTDKWAEKLGIEAFTVSSNSLTDLLLEMKELCTRTSADYVIFTYNDLPFLNIELTKDLISTHTEYKSEYTFADGYPYGFTPELIAAGTIGILAELSKTTQKVLGDAAVTRDGIYNLLKTDINSFEVEAELAPNDWRLYRFAFHCGKKENFLQCKALCEAAGNKIDEASADELSKIASETIGCLKTVPGFYNLQIADKVHSNCVYLPYNRAYEEKNGLLPVNSSKIMDYQKFCELVDKINDFSEKAVVSLSNWGEPLTHPDCLKMIEKILSYDGLSVFIETDGLLVTEDFCNKLKAIVDACAERTNGWQKIMIAVSIDAFSAATYTKLHKESKEEDFAKAVNAVSMLCAAVPDGVYPQFVRMNDNEEELEGFFRYWNEKTNPSNGNLIIQKYDDFAGLLPDCKPADLSPLERNPCWHIRRDMNILSNGDVTVCRACVLSEVQGNVFTESLEQIWHKNDDLLLQHIKQNYNGKCGKCDESYTYNF